MATKHHIIQCYTCSEELVRKHIVKISALKLELIGRNRLIVHENKTNNLILYNSRMEVIKMLEGVPSADSLELDITSQYYDLC